MSCAICEKRPPKRYCPAKGEKICAICCGREREVTIDCPSDCPHLTAAHRYEAEHRKPLSAEEYPYREVSVREDFVYERWPVVAGLAAAILNFQVQHKDLNDSAVCAAIEALAETLRTLGTGIYYERPPDAPLARALYGRIAGFLQEFKQSDTGRAGTAPLKKPMAVPARARFSASSARDSLFRPRSKTTLPALSFPDDYSSPHFSLILNFGFWMTPSVFPNGSWTAPIKIPSPTSFIGSCSVAPSSIRRLYAP